MASPHRARGVSMYRHSPEIITAVVAPPALVIQLGVRDATPVASTSASPTPQPAYRGVRSLVPSATMSINCLRTQ